MQKTLTLLYSSLMIYYEISSKLMYVVINQTFTCIVYVNSHDKNDKFHLEKITTEQVV